MAKRFGIIGACCLGIFALAGVFIGVIHQYQNARAEVPAPLVSSGKVEPATQRSSASGKAGRKVASHHASTAPASEAAQTQIATLLHSESIAVREVGTNDLRDLLRDHRDAVVQHLVPWLPLIYQAGLSDQMLSITQEAVEQTPEDTAMVFAAEQYRVRVLEDLGRWPAALSDAKGTYNVAPQRDVGSAVSLLADAMSRAGAGQDSTIGTLFRQQQMGAPVSGKPADDGDALPTSTDDLAPIAFKQISVTSWVSADVIDRLGLSEKLKDLVGLGNLLLISDRPADASKAFLRALKSPDAKGKALFSVIDGLARCQRARDGNFTGANALLASLKAGNIPPEFMSAGLNIDAAMRANLMQAGARVPKAAYSIGSVPPPLEVQRSRDEAKSGGENSNQILVSSDFECAELLSTEQISPTHYRLTFPPTSITDWFLIRVDGAEGKTVRFDIKGQESLGKWASLNPVISAAPNLRTIESFRWTSSVSDSIAARTTAWNGAVIPDTKDQPWQFISDCWMNDDQTFSFVRRIDQPRVYIAMRVPYTPGYQQAYLQSLGSKGYPYAAVHEIGATSKGRPLDVVEIGQGTSESRKSKPCILIYAGEHADEHDAMWIAHGVIENLLGDAENARHYRDDFTTLVIPMLDPDGTAAGVHEHLFGRFVNNMKLEENIAYANWFEKWVNDGNRLDLVLDLHNVQAAESSHVFCYQMQHDGIPGQASKAFNATLMSGMKNMGLTAGHDPAKTGWSPDRLGGWISRRFGAPSLLYEFNSQEPTRHLNLANLHAIGGTILKSTDAFFSGNAGRMLLSNIDERRDGRARQWAQFAGAAPATDAIESETLVAKVKIDGVQIPPETETWRP